MAALVAGLLALVPVLVYPRTDAVRSADAIVVLGGAHPRVREQRGLTLARQGYAGQLVLSNSHLGEDLPDHDLTLNRLCDSHFEFRLDCFAPEPDTTLGEARAVAALARDRGWRRVIVVTFTPHLARARHLLERCLPPGVELLMVDAGARLSAGEWIYHYPYQAAAYAKALTADC
ncbi:YdcF family protein [Nocardia sp. NPDC057353]|uniref:YdcF family protein n=1 Tax=Nocardia sp. NPDC057353 TaxID=3346104 RepID=UPI0036392CE7